MINTLPTKLRFPRPPWRIDQSIVDSPPPVRALDSYLEELRLWRSAVLEFISDPRPASEVGDLSERARVALGTFLAISWTEQMKHWSAQSPHNLVAFPANTLQALSDPTVNLMLEVLRWRAAVCDCLADTWDVIGDPYLDICECTAIGQFLRPATPKEICVFCLTEFTPEQLPPDHHECLLLGHVRAKWPPFPPTFAKGAE
jgi:hypothetical protein